MSKFLLGVIVGAVAYPYVIHPLIHKIGKL
jgi:hypothetical protein